MNTRELRASEPQTPWVYWMRAVLKVARFVLMLLVAPVIYVLTYHPMDTQLAMRENLIQLSEQRDVLRNERDKLLRRMEWIKEDDSYLETAARDRLHLQKEGEYVIRFE
ncbi:MAG: septum formation initiator family protein [Prosthecobacter sp.]